MKRLSALILAVLMCFPAMTVSVSGYSASELDETRYHLTGCQRNDIVGVALTQVGYHEGGKRSEKDGTNTAGESNFTKYSEYCGFDAAWCAMFIVWCARKAGIDASSGILDSTTCAAACASKEAFNIERKSPAEYTPRVGDLVFFDLNIEPEDWVGAYSDSGHVGIVYLVDDKRIYTVEGNSENSVVLRKYTFDSTNIVGYGIPKYNTDLEFGEIIELPGTFMVTRQKSLNAYEGASRKYGAKAKAGEKGYMYVSDFENGWGKTQAGYIYLHEATLVMPDLRKIVIPVMKASSLISRLSLLLCK